MMKTQNIKNLLITGGAGFIGSNFIKLLFETRNYKIINYDLLTYSGNLENLKEVENHPNYKFYQGDICDFTKLDEIIKNEQVDGIINFAAESHVDKSILDATPFVNSNIQGVLNLMNVARKNNIQRFLQISTDEVYGSADNGETFSEVNNLLPNSPYSASKASADLMVRAFVQTYNFPAIITRSSNNYGPYQYPEKFIPLIISNAMNGKKIPLYGNGMNIRDWIYVQDNCSAVLDVFEKGRIGEIYNIAGNNEKTNIEIIHTILELMNADKNLIEFVKDRPAHDRRYSINSDKLKTEIGWIPKFSFEKGIQNTIDWYLNNPNWLENVIKRTNFKEYYQTQYGVS